MNKEELHRRAVKAATQSILRRGYEVIDADWESVCGNRVDLVAEDRRSLWQRRAGLHRSHRIRRSGKWLPRRQPQPGSAEWLAASSPADGDLKVRFDTISLIVLNEQRAFMRHHTNVFSQA